MENTGGPAKYLHKKFKKPTETSESVPQPVNNNASAIPTVTIHNAIKFETSKLLTTADATNITNVDHNKNSFKNSSTKTSLSNDQKASISTDLVPQKQPYSLPSSLHQTNSILDNVSTVLRLNKSSYDISSGSDDTQRSDDPQSSFSTCQTNVDVRKPQELSDTSKSNENEDKKQTEPSQSGKYVCSYCNLSCSKPSVLQKHIRAHTNERPYPCVSCGFSFKTRSNLYKHCRSRSHANRAKDSPEVSVSVSNKLPDILQQSATNAPVSVKVSDADCVNKSAMEVTGTNKNVELNMKSKPYKPKFHKLFHLEQNSVEDDKEKQEEKKVDVIPTKPFSSELVKQNPDLLKQHINNLIHKNQTILDVKEPNLLKKRILTNNSETDENLNRSYLKNCYETTDEPLNLTARNRKRCMSETEHTQKSLIKELLLKNLAQEQSYVCQFCKISFKNIENFESHRKNYCKVGQNPTSKDIAFVRSHSVNVASVLTQKYSRNNESPTKFVRTTLPLKSPGPFLGKTSLINDKPNQVFYENRNPTKLYPAAFSDLNKKDTSPVLQAPSKYNNENLLKMIPENESPKKRPYDDFQITLGRSNIKKPSVKLFGGEVITDTSEDIRNCVKLEPKSATEYSPNSPKFVGYGIKVSENMVIKSSLQSGGTVLQSTPTYENKMSPFTPSETPSPSFQFFSNREISPRKNYEIENGRRTTPTRFDFNIKPGQEQMYDQGLIEMNQKAAKMFAPNLKHPNLTIPGLPIPNKVFNSPKRHFSDNFDQVSPSWSTLHSPLFSPSIAKLRPDVNPTTPDVFTPTKSETIKFPESLKPLSYTVNNSVIVTRSSPVTGFGISLRDPLNIVVDGKLLRHVPGMPGPETASPVHLGFGPQILSSPIMSVPKIIRTSPLPKEKYNLYQEKQRDKFEHRKTPTKEMYERPASRNLDENLRKINESISISRSKNILEASEVQKKSLKNFRIFSENSMKTIKSIESSDRSDISSKSPLKAEVSECDESKSETHTITTIESQERPSSKFLRPNTLALKPYMKTHHGLTPTMFNQALISPDTPRVAKKYCQLYLNGNCFSYLGLKSSTKVTYCTLNKTQPFYVTSFGKLSMYSEWRHLESKINFNRMDTYDSRQRRRNYTVARTKVPDIVVDSSYKSVMVESPHKRDELNNRTTLPGGYESNEDYTYIRGRGRGRYVCDQCGIRCKKPSMLKKHIRTHSDVRPYTCQHCNFSFKTKGNLTKHMKSKSHYKRTNTNNGSSGEGNNCDNPPTNSGSPSDDDSDSDNEMDNDSDDSTRLQEHEAAHCLLSLAQNSTIITKPTNAECINVETRMSPCSTSDNELNLIVSKCNMSLSKEEKSNISEHPSVSKSNFMDNMFSKKPLMYPYYKVQSKQAAENPEKKIEILKSDLASNFNNVILGAKNIEFISQTIESLKNIHSSVDLLSPANISTPTKITLIGNKLPNADITLTTFQQKFVKYEQERAMGQNKGFDFNVKKQSNMQTLVENRQLLAISPDFRRKRTLEPEKLKVEVDTKRRTSPNQSVDVSFNKSEAGIHRKRHISVDILPHNINSNSRKRKISLDYGENFDIKKNLSHSLQKNNNQPYDMNTRAMDLSVSKDYVENRNASARNDDDLSTTSDVVGAALDLSRVSKSNNIQSVHHDSSANHEYRFNSEITNSEINQEIRMSIKKKLLNYKQEKKEEPVNHETPDKIRDECIINLTDNSQSDMDQNSSDNSINNNIKSCESDTSAMQTLAEIAMKRVNLENTKLAQSVASEYLKLATKNETVGSGVSESSAGSNGSSDAVLSDLIVKSEENKSCTICAKNFSKASQLRLHMNIHYLERPFRCESCSVSFRTKGHLQKHERSASHHNKLSSSPTTNSSEPRPFKCSDCNIAFRIHGHLAKHLRSKMHIMKLECLARVPFGLYAELERANSLLTEINTTDCDMCLDSLKILARKLFSNDPNKLELLENPPSISSNNQEQLAVGSP